MNPIHYKIQSFCTPCIRKYVQTKIESGIYHSIRCPINECKVSVRLSDNRVAKLVGPELFVKWSRDRGNSYIKRLQALLHDSEYESVAKMLQMGDIIVCPECAVLISKNGGCNSMCCSECGCQYAHEAIKTSQVAQMQMWRGSDTKFTAPATHQKSKVRIKKAK